MPFDLKIKRLYFGTTMINKAHRDDLGYDLFSSEFVALKPNTGVVGVHTGIAIEFPPYFGAIIKDRSSMAKLGILTCGGVIDSGYRGEIIVLMYNISESVFSIQAGQKIAQMILTPIISADVYDTSDELAASDRGTNGFGSTGK